VRGLAAKLGLGICPTPPPLPCFDPIALLQLGHECGSLNSLFFSVTSFRLALDATQRSRVSRLGGNPRPASHHHPPLYRGGWWCGLTRWRGISVGAPLNLETFASGSDHSISAYKHWTRRPFKDGHRHPFSDGAFRSFIQSEAGPN
jgi:hypothetical protein